MLCLLLSILKLSYKYGNNNCNSSGSNDPFSRICTLTQFLKERTNLTDLPSADCNSQPIPVGSQYQTCLIGAVGRLDSKAESTDSTTDIRNKEEAV